MLISAQFDDKSLLHWNYFHLKTQAATEEGREGSKTGFWGFPPPGGRCAAWEGLKFFLSEGGIPLLPPRAHLCYISCWQSDTVASQGLGFEAGFNSALVFAVLPIGLVHTIKLIS